MLIGYRYPSTDLESIYIDPRIPVTHTPSFVGTCTDNDVTTMHRANNARAKVPHKADKAKRMRGHRPAKPRR